MIEYCIVCYLVAFGILLNEHEDLHQWTNNDIICFIFAPFCIPVIFGMYLNDKKK